MVGLYIPTENQSKVKERVVQCYQPFLTMPFNLRSKTIFLTYSQLSEDGARIFFADATNHYKFIVSTLGNPTQYRLSRERHQDGGLHAHAYVAFASAVRIQSQHRLDFGLSHPNIQSVRTGHKTTWDYVGKDGDIIYEQGGPPEEPRAAKTREHAIWSEIVGQPTEESFYNACRELAPKYFALYQQQLERYAAKYYSPEPEPYISPTYTDLSDERCGEWLEQAKIGIDGITHRRRSLILWGPSRTGKTVWARSLGESCPSLRGYPLAYRRTRFARGDPTPVVRGRVLPYNILVAPIIMC